LLNTNTDLSLLVSCYSHREVHHTNTHTRGLQHSAYIHQATAYTSAHEHTQHRPTL